MDKFIVTIECTDPHTLGALIARGLESQAKITNIEAVGIPTATIQAPKADIVKIPEPAPAPKKVVIKRVDGYKLYRFALQLYHPQKTFTSSELRDQWRAWGREVSDNSVSAHMHRWEKMGIVERVDGCGSLGYVYQLKRPVTRAEFESKQGNYSALKGRQTNGR